jgi:outer membrane protein assembly factor BamD (BamD/ComL family)
MRNVIIILSVIFALTACQPSEDEKAQTLMAKIETLYQKGHYKEALDSISALREKHPKAIESRKKALKLWQMASLKMVQEDIGKTDSALQAQTRLFDKATSLREKNFLGIKKDSLQIRYDALCGTVRIIHKRQQE